MKNRIYFSRSLDGYENLALDEYFLDHVAPDELILYFYVNENAVIIGKNQNPLKECALDKMAADGVQLVRRISGGGAVYHDCGNLNFSFIAGAERYDKEQQHRLILEAVRALGISCAFSGRNDLLAGGRKFSGNAYCTRGNAKQHHGTLLISSDLEKLSKYLTADPRKLKAKGVDSVRSRVCNLAEICPGLTVEKMKTAIPSAFERVYGGYEPLMPDEEMLAIVACYREKHASDAWRLGQTPPFDLKVDERCSFGGIELFLKVEKGRVKAAELYTDANAEDLPERVKKLLIGSLCTAEALSRPFLQSEDAQLKEIGKVLRRI